METMLMMKIIVAITLMLLNIVAYAGPKVILKFDDISAQNHQCEAKQVMQYLVDNRVKASYGVIASKLDETALSALENYIKAKKPDGTPLVEIWHHGLDHSRSKPPSRNTEFKGQDYAFQKKHFEVADALVKKYLHVQMRSFGAPFNSMDDVTIKVILENPAYHVIMLSGLSGTPGLTFLNNRVNMEDLTKGKGLNYDYFVKNYNQKIEYQKSYMVIQGHPNGWTQSDFEIFKRIIKHLIDKKSTFMLPSEMIQ